MMVCLQCSSPLDSYFVSGGTSARCVRCGLVYLSVAHLMEQSDRGMVRQFWEYVLACSWTSAKVCPRCGISLSAVPLLHGDTPSPVLACKACFHLILEDQTMEYFEKEKPDAKRDSLTQRIQEAQRPDSLERLLERIAGATKSRWVFRLSHERGREYSFAFTAGGLLLVVAAFTFLRKTGDASHWGFLAMACAFGIGLRFSRATKQDATSKSKERQFSELKDLGPQSRMPTVNRRVRNLSHRSDLKKSA